MNDGSTVRVQGSKFRVPGIFGVMLSAYFVLLGSAATSSEDQCIDYGSFLGLSAVVSVPGLSSSVLRVGDFAYVGTSENSDFGSPGGLHIVNVRDPQESAIVGSVLLPGGVEDLHAARNFIVTVDGTWLRLIDVSDSSSPQEVGSVNVPGESHRVSVAGDFAYVASLEDGLHVVDLSDPSDPRRVGGIELPGKSRGVAALGGVALVASEAGWLHVVDVTNPAVPLLSSSVVFAIPAFDVAVHGPFAYVVASRVFPHRGELHVVDVSTPESAEVVGSLDIWTESGIRPRRITVRDGHAALSGGDEGVALVDVRVPGRPRVLGTIDPADARDSDLEEGRLFVADRYQGVLAIRTQNPKPVASFAGVETEGESHCVAVSGRFAYSGSHTMYGFMGLEVIDMTEPHAPLHVASVEVPGGVYGLAVDGGFAFAASGGTGLSVVDVRNPASMRVAANLDTPGHSVAITLKSGHAFVADGPAGLQIFDIRNPEAPLFVSSVDTRGSGVDVDVRGNIVMLADYTGGLQLIDVSNPSAPAIVGSIDDGHPVRCVASNSTGVFFTTLDGGYSGGARLVSANVDETGVTVILDRLELGVTWNDLLVRGGIAYFAPTQGIGYSGLGVFVVDVSDPSRLRAIGHVDTPGRANGLAAMGNFLAVADEWTGFQVARAQCDPTISDFERWNGDADRLEATAQDAATPPGAARGVPTLLRASKPPLLSPAMPSPFSEETRVGISLESTQHVRLAVYSTSGRIVRTLVERVMDSGSHSVRWDGRSSAGDRVAAGIYFVRMETAGERVALKVVLLDRR